MTNRIFVPEILGGIDDALLAECDELVLASAHKATKHRSKKITFILAAALFAVLVSIASVIFIMNQEDDFTPPDNTDDPAEEKGFVIEDGILISYTGNAEEIVIPDGVVEISKDAFLGNTTLRVLTLSSSVKEIPNGSLTSCENLVEVRVADNGEIRSENGLILSSDGTSVIFANKEMLPANLVIPKGVTTIGGSIFKNSPNLKSVALPSTMETVGVQAFYGCKSLISISLGGTKLIGELAFMSCDALSMVDIGNVETIGRKAFANCKSLVKISLGGTKTLEEGAFMSCEALAEVNFGSVRVIGKQAFMDCGSLRNVKFIDVRSVQEQAFMGSGVNTLDMGKTLGTIGKMAFVGCNISTVYIPVSLQTVSKDAFLSNKITKVYYRGNQTQWDTMNVKYTFLDRYTGYELIFVDELPPESKYTFKFESNRDGTCTAVPENVPTIQGVVTVPEKSPDGDIVTSIGAFRNAAMITEVYLPESVTSIPEYAFSGCSSLRKIEMPGVTQLGGYAFSKCISLSDVKLNPGVSVIPTRAFSDCSSLKSLVIHDGVTQIGNSAFLGCGIKEYVLPSSITKIGNSAFAGSRETNVDCAERVDISATQVKSLIHTFAGAENLREVVLPETLEIVGERAFYYCRSLKSVSLPASVQQIGSEAFYECRMLEEINLPSGLKNIGESAFVSTLISSLTIPESVINYRNCFMYMPELRTVVFEKAPEYIDGFWGSGIERFVVPDGVTTINSNAFRSCENLKEIVIADSVKIIGANAFASCSSLERIVVPDTVESMGTSAFSGCSSLKEVVLPSSLTEIGYAFFHSCTSLESITVKEGVTSIGKFAFKGCTSLSSVNLAPSVKTIAEEAFSGCTSLKEFKGEGVESFGDKCFYQCGFEALVIPDSVKTIGASCFEENKQLRELTFSNNTETIGERVFASCVQLESVVMAGTIKELPKETFYFCVSLKTVVLPPMLEVIGTFSFHNCTSMEEFTTPNTLISIERYAFSRCSSLKKLVLTEGIENIKEYAFKNCAIVELRIPSSVKSIGYDVFTGATSLKTITFAKSSAKMGPSFRTLLTLETIILEDPTDMVFNGTFNFCTSLKKVEILNGTLSVEDEMFARCKSLSEIDFSKIVKIGKSAFSGCTSLPSELVFNENIKRLSRNSFNGCTSIETVKLPVGLEFVESDAFKNCTALREMTIGRATAFFADSLTDCTALKKIIYPGSEEMFNTLVESRGDAQILLQTAEKEYLNEIS